MDSNGQTYIVTDEERVYREKDLRRYAEAVRASKDKIVEEILDKLKEEKEDE